MKGSSVLQFPISPSHKTSIYYNKSGPYTNWGSKWRGDSSESEEVPDTVWKRSTEHCPYRDSLRQKVKWGHLPPGKLTQPSPLPKESCNPKKKVWEERILGGTKWCLWFLSQAESARLPRSGTPGAGREGQSGIGHAPWSLFLLPPSCLVLKGKDTEQKQTKCQWDFQKTQDVTA